MRTLIALLAAALCARAFADPNAASDSQRKTAVALARANRWSDALVSINEAIRLAPTDEEPIFLRAGIYLNLAGAPSTLEALAELKQDVDYTAITQNLGAARADLETYLKLSPNAPNAGQVSDAIAELRAREIASKSNDDAIHVWRASEKVKADLAEEDKLDPGARVIGQDDLARTSDLDIGFGIGESNNGTSFGSAASVTGAGAEIRASFLVHRNVKLGAELPLGSTFGDAMFQVLGNVTVNALWLHDLSTELRVGASAGLTLPTATGDRATGARFATELGLGSIGAFWPGSDVRASADVRLSRHDGFAQAQLRFDQATSPSVTIVQAVFGGGYRIRSRTSLIGEMPIAIGSAMAPWTGNASYAAAVRFGIRFPLGAKTDGLLHVEVPFAGAASAGTFMVSLMIDRGFVL